MRRHAAEQAVEHADRGVDVRPLVEEDAFGAGGHRRVGHLAARRQPLPDQVLEHLRRPDHRDMGGLAQPQHLLLHFRHPLEAHFDGEIAAGDHHREGLFTGGLDKDFRQVAHRSRRFDLADEAEAAPVRGAGGELGLEHGDLRAGPDEGIADEVGVLDDEAEILAILVGERIEAEIGVGEVQALLGLELHPAEPGVLDADEEAAVDGAGDAPLHLAVVDRDLVADGEAVERFGRRTGHLERRLRERGRHFAAKKHKVADEDARPVGRRQDVAGPDLRPGDVHQDRYAPAEPGLGGADIADHPRPFIRPVVGAVDPDRVGPVRDEAGDHRRILGGLGRQRHHDPVRTAMARRPEDLDGVGGEPPPAAAAQPGGGRPPPPRPPAPAPGAPNTPRGGARRRAPPRNPGGGGGAPPPASPASPPRAEPAASSVASTRLSARPSDETPRLISLR